MPRRRVKTRVEHLADALALAQAAQDCLGQVDLRTTRGELREAVKGAKAATDQMIDELGRAVVADVPAPRMLERHVS